MFKIIQNWIQKHFSHPEAVLLVVIISSILATLMIFGNILAPVIASIIISYLLSWWVNTLEKKVNKTAAVLIVYFCFLGIFLGAIFFILPLLWHQLSNLFNDLPNMIKKAETILYNTSEFLPDFISKESFIQNVKKLIPRPHETNGLGNLLQATLSYLPDLITWMIYLVVCPFLVFFFLKDKEEILSWSATFLPKHRPVLNKVWSEVNEQFGKYVRGKVTEFVIVTILTYISFLFFNLNYSALLAVLVGASVLIPYVGAFAVTIPVALVGYFQFGFSITYVKMLTTYGIIQGFDGGVLVPLLFSEAVNIHPIAIVVAILFFGEIWGFWGVFFAIPLATVVKALMYAWPKNHEF